MRTSLLLAALAATGLAPLAAAQTIPCRAAGTCDQDLQLVITQNDGVAGGTLALAIQVRTDGVAPTNTLGSATIDIEIPRTDGTVLAPANIIPGELCPLPAYTCAVNVNPTTFDVIRLGITTANVGSGFGQNAGYNVPETYVTFVTYEFTILDPNAVVNFVVRTNTLTVGYFESPNNSAQDGRIDGFVEFDILDNATNVPLPVEMTDFEAVREDAAVLLSWSTVSETQNAGFAVERATLQTGAEALAWEQVGYVDGAGTTSAAQTYRFRDADLPYQAAAVRYRLTQVDLDGQRTTAGEAEVEVGAPATFQLLAPFPNPAQHAATIRYELPRADRAAVVVYNALGQEVARLADGEQEAGRYEVALETGRLAPGIYVVRFVAGGVSATRKLTVVR